MSITKQVTIWCDMCSDWEQDSTTASKLRKELKANGWSSVAHYSIRDYCPTCTKRRAEATPIMLEAAAKKYAQEVALGAATKEHK